MSTLKTAALRHQRWLNGRLHTVFVLVVTLVVSCGAASFEERLVAAVLMAEAQGEGVAGHPSRVARVEDDWSRSWGDIDSGC